VFDPAYLTELLVEIGVDPHEIVFDKVSFDLSEQFQNQLQILFSHRKNEHSSVLSFDCMASSILLELLVKYQNSASQKVKHEIAKGKYPSNIARAKQITAQNVTNPDFSLDDLAKLSGISKFHLVRTFKSQVGLTPIQYLNQIRIEIAMGRLKDAHTKVSELAIALGYRSFSAFTKAFRKQVKLSPRQFQKIHQS